MTVKDLIDQLRRFYPANAEVLVAVIERSSSLGPVSAILLDEKRNTVELISD